MDYTTIALTDDDKEELDAINFEELDGDGSYREIVGFLIDEYKNQSEKYDIVLARAIARADGDDVERVVQRVESDKEFVEQLSASDD